MEDLTEEKELWEKWLEEFKNSNPKLFLPATEEKFEERIQALVEAII